MMMLTTNDIAQISVFNRIIENQRQAGFIGGEG